MTITRLALRQELGLDIAGESFIASTVAATADTSHFKLNEFLDSGGDNLRFKDRFALRVTSGEVRRITVMDKGTGIATVHRAFTALAVSDAMEIHRFDPALIHKAIDRGLARAFRITLIQLSPTSGSAIIDLAAYPWLTSHKQLYSVMVGDDPAVTGGTPPREISYAHRFEDGFLYIDAPAYLSTGEKLWVRALQPYEALANDAATTACPTPYALAAARVELYKLLIQRAGPGREAGRYGMDLKMAQADLTHQARIYGGAEPKKYGPKTPVRWGAPYRRSR